MDTLIANVLESARQLGIETCLELAPGLLVPEQRIRELCFENKCGKYRNHYMCPPYVGSLPEITTRLKKFQRGVLLQHSQPLDVRNDAEGLKQTKTDFHHMILRVEEFSRNEESDDVWGMMGGSCALCDVCKAKLSEPCPYPDKARTSLESIAVDVLALLEKSGLDNRFHPDKITWTGFILF